MKMPVVTGKGNEWKKPLKMKETGAATAKKNKENGTGVALKMSVNGTRGTLKVNVIGPMSVQRRTESGSRKSKPLLNGVRYT